YGAVAVVVESDSTQETAGAESPAARSGGARVSDINWALPRVLQKDALTKKARGIGGRSQIAAVEDLAAVVEAAGFEVIDVVADPSRSGIAQGVQYLGALKRAGHPAVF